MSDNISRQAAIDALRYAQHRFTVADEAGGTGTVKWSEYVIYFAAAERVLTELPSADAVQGWIPCSERLPDEYDEYLCQCGDGDMIVGWLENSKWCKQHVAKETIVAWMPLPEPYREGGEEK